MKNGYLWYKGLWEQKKKQKMEIYIDDTPTYGTNSKVSNKKKQKNNCKQSKEKQTNADDS